MGGLRLVAHTSRQLPKLPEAAARAARTRSEDYGGRDGQLEDRRFLPLSDANVHEGRLQAGRHRRFTWVNILIFWSGKWHLQSVNSLIQLPSNLRMVMNHRLR